MSKDFIDSHLIGTYGQINVNTLLIYPDAIYRTYLLERISYTFLGSRDKMAEQKGGL